jgi:hypothetical protein
MLGRGSIFLALLLADRSFLFAVAVVAAIVGFEYLI